VNRQRGFPSLFLTRISSKEPASRKEEGNNNNISTETQETCFIHSFIHSVTWWGPQTRRAVWPSRMKRSPNNTQTQTQNTKGERTTNAAALDPGTRVEVAHW
jgi:hypothetical protein